MSCKRDCCSLIDDLLEQIQAGLGKVDYDKINEYIDEKIEELKDAIAAGDITVDVDLEELINKLKDAFADGTIDLDAYKVTYKNTTVGAVLDELRKNKVAFEGTISKFRQYNKGEKVYNVPVSFSFTKPLKTLILRTYINDQETGTFLLDTDVRRFELPKLSATTQVVVEAVSEDDERLVLTSTARFDLKYYVGCCGSSRITNKEALALTSYYAVEGVNNYSFIFHAIGPQYMWWIFPVDLHTDYDFFNNGLMDSDYVWTVDNLTNEYGYTSQYLFIRSNHPHTASNIYSEVKAHEHK